MPAATRSVASGRPADRYAAAVGAAVLAVVDPEGRRTPITWIVDDLRDAGLSAACARAAIQRLVDSGSLSLTWERGPRLYVWVRRTSPRRARP